MTHRFVIGAVVALGLLGASPARAQQFKGDVAGGYSLMHDSDLETTFPAGWFASASGAFNRMWAIAGEVSGNYKTETATANGASVSASISLHTYAVGPRVMFPGGERATVFGQFLIGASSGSISANGSASGQTFDASVTNTNLCLQPGFGVDVDFTKKAGFRAQANFRVITAEDQTINEFQLLLGVVYRFGR
ncbi:MAG TPA: outer membrane beta-barrel protein [Vicinamibacterales bacterium]|nr:outer membrane beta-barrel protein [Vicinamibacterales bacterium]